MQETYSNLNIEELQEMIAMGEKEFRAYIETFDYGIVLFNLKGLPILCNEITYSLLGLRKDQFIKKSKSEFYWKYFPIIDSIAECKPIYGVIMSVFRPKTNDRVWLEVDTDLILGKDGNIKMVVGTFKDEKMKY